MWVKIWRKTCSSLLVLSAFRLPRPVPGLRGGLLSAFCILALLLPTALPAESKFPWVYRHVELVRVVDGDTVRLNIEVAPGLWQRNQSCRLADVNAPELGTEAGEKAKLDLERRLLPFVWRPPGATRYLAIEVRGRDKYGRWLVRLVYGATQEAPVQPGGPKQQSPP